MGIGDDAAGRAIGARARGGGPGSVGGVVPWGRRGPNRSRPRQFRPPRRGFVTVSRGPRRSRRGGGPTAALRWASAEGTLSPRTAVPGWGATIVASGVDRPSLVAGVEGAPPPVVGSRWDRGRSGPVVGGGAAMGPRRTVSRNRHHRAVGGRWAVASADGSTPAFCGHSPGGHCARGRPFGGGVLPM